MRVFEEKQWFDQWWLWAMLIIVSGVFLLQPIRKISHNGAFALDYLDTGFWIGFAVMLPVILLFRSLALYTEIDEHGIRYRFAPFQGNPKQISWQEIEKCHTRKYRPLLEYGGWGMRMGSKGGAYNVRGNFGIQIKFKNGNKLLIGTQKPKEAQQIIDKYFNNERI